MTPRLATGVGCAAVLLFAVARTFAQPFHLPTANRALYEPGGEEKFFVGTAGKPWTSGTFGCVRSEGWQMHEGLDIRSLQRDIQGEPTDPVMATADGEVAYVNAKPSLSTFGKYIVLRHQIHAVEVYSTYAHLSQIRNGLLPGQRVKAGETIATMGRTANTRQSITKDRAHLHFELNLLINDRFPAWYRKYFPDQRNDHGAWNGQNLVALDPRRILLEQRRLGTKFNLLSWLRNESELCRVLVTTTNFPWLKRYAPLVRSNPKAESEGVAGYEIALNFNAVPFELIPRAPSEIKGKSKFQILSVNEAEQRKNPCRKLVTKRSGRWEFTSHGQNALNLLTY
jgi:murein DD-endopeptidase MepM/ murein hydrolase activator NlpD